MMAIEQNLLVPPSGNAYLFRWNNKRPVSAKRSEDGSDVEKDSLTTFPAKRDHLCPRDASPIGIRIADNRFLKREV